MILGIDISRSDVAVILAKPDGGVELALRSSLPREGGAPAVWIAAMETAHDVLRRAFLEPSQIQRVGLAFDAPIDEQGVISKSPGAVGWQGYDLHRALHEHLGVANTVVESRVFCEAMGEYRFGALRPTKNEDDQDQPHTNWLFIHIGATIGGAAVVNGQPLRGAARAAVDIGAICIERDGALCASGRHGCLEGYCGGDAFMARARSYSLTVKTPQEIWDVAGTNFMAQSLCVDYAERLAQGLGSVLAVLNPQRLVLGGSLAIALGEKLLSPLRLRIREYCLPAHFNTLDIACGQLANDAAVLGAVAIAMHP